jgi:hypothetical protein
VQVNQNFKNETIKGRGADDPSNFGASKPLIILFAFKGFVAFRGSEVLPGKASGT